jgi:type II secretory pathway component PulF
MSTFRYKAINQAGRMTSGVIDATSLDHANDLLGARGLSPVEMQDHASARSGARLEFLSRSFNAVHPEELILFTKQVATMLKAGIPVLRVMDILESQSDNPRLKDVCRKIATDIRAGSNLSRALKKFPDVFSPLYSSMVLAGEASGSLPQVLQRLIYIISHEYKVKSDVRSVVQYPVIVLIALVASFVLLITMVIPRFAVIYQRAQIDLPAPTVLCIWLSRVFNQQWPWILATLSLLAGLAVYAVHTTRGRLAWDRFKLQIPLVGPLLKKAALSRFSSIFSILQASGVGILDAIKILSGTIGNTAIGRELEGLQKNLEQGHGVARPLMNNRYFTPMLVNMIAVGEEAGNLDEMLREVSVHYDAEVEYATRRLTTAMGPILIVALAALVGFFALAVYMPMWDLAKLATRGAM